MAASSEHAVLWPLALLALPFAGALLLALVRTGLGTPRRAAGVAVAVAVLSGFILVWGWTDLPPLAFAHATLPWAPSLGLDLNLLGDRLSLAYAAAAIGIGALVILYSLFYFGNRHPPSRRFYGVLLAFMGSMVGAVLADHLLALYGFWELTGVASFLLIGTDHADRDARVAARQALLVTFATGLCLLAGLLLLGQIAGSLHLSAIVTEAPGWADDPRLPVAIVLTLIGALGKSAQLPFQFWLTGAMVAPTPVSAYLHSATMVKLGVYLCARLDPAFATWPAWSLLLLVCGWSTMLVAGIFALFAQDIKAALAFATVSVLGYLLGLYGIRAEAIAATDLLHVGNHALYKACLFMVAGIVAHVAGTRDLRRLGGLARTHPALAAVAAVALASMCGLPGTAGFVSEELIVHPLLEPDGSRFLAGLFAAGTALKTMFALRLFSAVFLGPAPSHVRRAAASPGRLVPAAVLAGILVLVGVWPQFVTPLLAETPVTGRAGTNVPPVTAWPGFTAELGFSLGSLGVGVLLYFTGAAARVFQHALPSALAFEGVHARLLRGLESAARGLNRLIQVDRPFTYLPAIVFFATALTAGLFVWPELAVSRRLASMDIAAPPWRWVIGALIAAAALGVTVFRLWTTQLLALSIAGFLLCIYFALFRAPDLALTQILVEALLLLLFVLLLARFPKSVERGERSRRLALWVQGLNPLLAIMAGAGTTIGLLLLSRPLASDPVGHEHLRLSEPAAHAANAVNAIIVNFRGLDTLGESMVLITALLGSLGLLMRFRRREHPPPAAHEVRQTGGERP